MIILCDFDDTAAAQNVGQLLLERFHPGSAALSGMPSPGSDVRRRYVDKEISLAEYQEIAFRQVDDAPLSEQRALRARGGHGCALDSR